MPTPVWIEIHTTMEGDKPSIKTNLKHSKVAEILGEFLRAQMGKGRDDRKPNKKARYRIYIVLNLDDDSFHWEHDTGNDALATGMVMELLPMVKAGKVKIE